MWICDFCNNNSGSAQLTFNQIQFVEHLRNEHLYKFNINRNVVFRCSYGHNDQCFTLIEDEKILSEFNSEKEYGIHLVRAHLKQSKIVDGNHFSVSDKGCLENSRNYEIVRNPSSNATHKWTLHHSVVNLPAALNDPNNRQLDIFSKTWGESFEKAEPPPCMTLLSPTKFLFDPYIKQVRSSLKYRETMLRKINAEKQQDNSNLTYNQKADVDNVPKVFFQCDFNLNCKDIFVTVIPIFQTASNNSSSSSISTSTTPSTPSTPFTLLDNTITNKLSPVGTTRPKDYKWLTDNASHRMNEKLSHYLDIVEINIAKQVSKKSNSFFEAVSTQDKVQDKIKSALSQISVVRQKLQLSDTKLTKDHLQVLIYAQRKKNMLLLLRQLRVIKTVHSAQATIQTLLAINDFCGVLDLIAGTQSIMKVELFSSKNNESSPILCLKHVWAQLLEMKIFVEKMVQQEFVNTISSQLRLEDDWKRSSKGIEIDYQMVPSLLAMMRIVVYNSTGNLNQFVQLYFDDAMEVLKTIVKSRVLQAFSKSCQNPESSVMISSQEEDIPKSLADQTRSLEYDEWLDLVNNICEDMLQLLEKVKMGCHTMIETLSAHIDETGLKVHGEGFMLTSECNPETLVHLRTLTVEDIKKLPWNISEAIEQRVVKLVRVRAKDGYMERLTPMQMVQLDNLLQNMVKEMCERLSLRSMSSSVLSSCVHSYANRLVTRFHNEHREKLVLILDSDLWRAADVPAQLQELARHINKETGLSLLHKNGTSSGSRRGMDTHMELDDTQSINNNQHSLQLDHNRFTVVAAALMLFQMIVEYCQCASDLQHIDSIAELVFTNLLTLLDYFNSRCCQLVLGAKARQLVELETISARNLALAARSLQMVLALSPRISVHFSNLSMNTDADGTISGTSTIKASLYTQLYDCEQNYQQHIDRINDKLISLMAQKITSVMATWTGRPPAPSTETRTICQHLTKLHEAIVDIYPASLETDLLLHIHNVFKSHLRARMRDLHIILDNGPQHGLVKLEVAYYMSQLNAFSGLHKFTDNFSDIFR